MIHLTMYVEIYINRLDFFREKRKLYFVQDCSFSFRQKNSNVFYLLLLLSLLLHNLFFVIFQRVIIFKIRIHYRHVACVRNSFCKISAHIILGDELYY